MAKESWGNYLKKSVTNPKLLIHWSVLLGSFTYMEYAVTQIPIEKALINQATWGAAAFLLGFFIFVDLATERLLGV